VDLQALSALTDKVRNGFVEAYRTLFEERLDRPVRLLEIGIHKGGSLLIWDALFRHPDTRIFGIDRDLPDTELPERIAMIRCEQNDSGRLRVIAEEHGPFDIVIDDGSHQTRETRNCFDVLFEHVRPGGYYVIEDWCVGYWSEMERAGVLQPAYKQIYRPEFDGMTRLITEVIDNAVARRVSGLNVQVAGSRCYACFQKAADL